MKAEDSEAAAQPRPDSAPLLIATGIEKALDWTAGAGRGGAEELTPGEVMGLLGANGAGKSTLSKVIFRPSHPRCGLDNVARSTAEPAERARGHRIWDHDGNARDLTRARPFRPGKRISR